MPTSSLASSQTSPASTTSRRSETSGPLVDSSRAFGEVTADTATPLRKVAFVASNSRVTPLHSREHLLVLIAVLIGLLCVSISWKHHRHTIRHRGHGHHSEAHEGTSPSARSSTSRGGPDVMTEFFEAAGSFKCPPTRLFTREEVAAHATRDDLYVVVDGNVLDVTSFITQHPGGEVLLDGAGGEDMASVFSQFHHPSSVSLFAAFCVGRIGP